MFNQPKGAGALCIAHTPLVRGTWAVSAALSQGALASLSHPADAGQSEGAATCVAELTAEPLMTPQEHCRESNPVAVTRQPPCRAHGFGH